MDSQIWIDLSFVNELAKNWADLLVKMQAEDFATDAGAFKIRVHETCDRLETLLKREEDDRAGR